MSKSKRKTIVETKLLEEHQDNVLAQATIALSEVYQALVFIKESVNTNIHKVKISKHLDRVRQLIEEGISVG